MSDQNIVLFITGKFWKFNYYSSLDIKELLNLLKTCKNLNKQKSYIYKLIYSKLIFHSSVELYDNMSIYNKSYVNIKELIILLTNNKILQNMLIRHYKKNSYVYYNVLCNFSNNLLEYINNKISLKTAISRIVNYNYCL